MRALKQCVRVCLLAMAVMAGLATVAGPSTSAAEGGADVAQDPPRQHLQSAPSQTQGQSPAGPPTFIGDCDDGWFWSGGPFAADTGVIGGGASYQECAAGDLILLMSCGPGWPDVRLEIESAPTAVNRGDAVAGVATVDGVDHPLSGRIAALVTGERITRLAIDRHEGLLDAMAAGQRMTLSVGAMELDLHLSGAGEALEAMLAACPESR